MTDLDSAYALAVAREGLYAVAFFGHRGRPGDRARCARIWRRLLRKAGAA